MPRHFYELTPIEKGGKNEATEFLPLKVYAFALKSNTVKRDGRTCFSTVFHCTQPFIINLSSYHEMLIMKGCVQWNPVFDNERLCSMEPRFNVDQQNRALKAATVTLRYSTAHIVSLSTSHRPDMTEILLKGT